MQLNNPEIIVNYPSGKQETWKPNITLLPANKLKRETWYKKSFINSHHIHLKNPVI